MYIKQRTLPANLPDLGSIPPLLQRIYAARGVRSHQELDNSFRYLLSYRQLKDIDAAVDLLSRAIQGERRILIVGDFDADGATATAVAVLGLRMLGATQVEFMVPNRFDYGYGLSAALVEQAHQQFAPDLIVTVDNGISSLEGVALAKGLGMQVLVTDHHLPGERLPEADAIVNPNQPGCAFPSKAMAGVGVMFYVLMALRAKMREQGLFGQVEPNLAQLLDLVALGTVADVVPLDANNRRLVHQGLARIRAGHARPGVKAIIESGRRNIGSLVAADLGFIVGPRLNAAGRMDDMSVGIECLLAEDPAQALALAQKLESLNLERKRTEQEMQHDALVQLQDISVETLPFGLCMYQPDWHQGVTGILASRLKERYHRPVMVFAQADDGSLKGSARSVAGFHIRDALADMAARYPTLIKKFGGHAMAAGLSIALEDFAEFARLFDAQVRVSLSAEELAGVCITDGQLSAGEFALDVARQLQQAGPWGQQFPEPRFHGRFRLLHQRLVGERHLKLQVQEESAGVTLDAIAFNVDLEQWPNPGIKYADLAYRLDVNEFRGQQSLQLMVEHLMQVNQS